MRGVVFLSPKYIYVITKLRVNRELKKYFKKY